MLLIHLKRFSAKGLFTDKIETTVEFPLRGLDLTNYMPPPLPPGASGGPQLPQDDPRCQMPPYRYDLYGVTNHFGTLSTGHCAFFFAFRRHFRRAENVHRYCFYCFTRRLAVLRRQPCITSGRKFYSSAYLLPSIRPWFLRLIAMTSPYL